MMTLLVTATPWERAASSVCLLGSWVYHRSVRQPSVAVAFAAVLVYSLLVVALGVMPCYLCCYLAVADQLLELQASIQLVWWPRQALVLRWALEPPAFAVVLVVVVQVCYHQHLLVVASDPVVPVPVLA